MIKAAHKIRLIKNKDLKTNDLNRIVKLKNSEWKYNIQNHKIWIRKNLKPQDVHFLLNKKNFLVGYNLLRKRKIEIESNSLKLSNKSTFYYFDTFIIDKESRKKGLAKLFINNINKYILKQKKLGLLLCKKDHLEFYKKFNWNLVNKNYFKIIDKKTKLNIMIFNNKIGFKIKAKIKIN
tara:strand:+ start:345 stop:881 length:537 start_codon:yes stop_codon:yes gene_type:complete